MNASAAPPADQGPVAGAVNAVAEAATGAVNAATGAVNAVAQAASAAVNAVIPGANKPANDKKNNAFTFNSLIPLGSATPPATNANKANSATNKPANAGFNLFGSATKPANNKPANNKPANAGFNLFGNSAKPANAVGVANAPPTFANFSVSKMANSPWALPIGIFVGLIVIFLIAFSVFNDQIKQGYEYVTKSFQQSVGLNTQTDVVASVVPIQGMVKEVTVPPVPPQAVTPVQHAAAHQNIVEKVLPSGGSAEVYNVAQNKFTFYDAEPLCKALGAELATYEQVKDAWSKGADWCNYGWVKGQMAIYPTQKDTYDKLQAGPADQKGACGTTGINGGYFENPDMLYGVNCYGKKPSQSAHDEAQLMDEGKIPKSPETLKVDQMMNDFKAQADSLFVKPFSDAKWSTK